MKLTFNCCNHEEKTPFCLRHFSKRLEKLESMTAMLDLSIKAKAFKVEMDEGNRFMECLSGLENKLSSEIRDVEMRLKSIHGKKPYCCPVCQGNGFKHHAMVQKIDCNSCSGKGVIWG